MLIRQPCFLRDMTWNSRQYPLTIRCFATTSTTIGSNTQVGAKVKKRSVQYTASVYYVYRLVASTGIRKYLACLPRGDRMTR